jgi:hypothetical protein
MLAVNTSRIYKSKVNSLFDRYTCKAKQRFSFFFNLLVKEWHSIFFILTTLLVEAVINFYLFSLIS